MLHDIEKNHDIAAFNLEGRTIKGIWEVKKLIKKEPGQSGSHFSVPYLVERDGKIYFMKAFNFGSFMQTTNTDGTDIGDALRNMLDAYQYEKDLSLRCQENYVTKVSCVTDYCEEMVLGFAVPYVPCLIFELASKGDVRKMLAYSEQLDDAWKFKSLHDIALGLRQLHTIDITHQDLKPSNVVVFENEESKLCDLGRSVCSKLKGPYDGWKYTGDINYAPPEIWYRYFDQDWNRRSFAIDCYMLGSMVVFYFTHATMSALLSKHLPNEFHVREWRGTYEELIPYMEKAFAESLNEIKDCIHGSMFEKDILWLITLLCNPFPEKRGHPSNQKKGNPYTMEQFISKFDLLRHKAEIHIKKL